MKQIFFLVLFLASLSNPGCQQSGQKSGKKVTSDSLSYSKSFRHDLELLDSVQDIILLTGNNESALVAISPAWQGRVMTSTLSGKDGQSLGWINHELIRSGRKDSHINAYGGEDRFWLGPEGGQFSIYFKPGNPFKFENWFVPPAIDTEPFDVVEKNQNIARFRKEMKLVNYSNYKFDLLVERNIRLLDRNKVSEILGTSINDLEFVAYESENRITNKGDKAWTHDTGMLSVWILGMFQPSASTTVIIPIKEGPESKLGPKANDSYFGKIPEDRLKIENNVLFFLADGKMRGKLGISPRRAKPYMGSYNEETNVLTVVKFSFDGKISEYVNSMWDIQDNPFAGDVANSYNDGPLEDGSQMGPFYELESSSPAAGLEPGSSLTHVHSTMHLKGDQATMDQIIQNVFGIPLSKVKAAFN